MGGNASNEYIFIMPGVTPSVTPADYETPTESKDGVKEKKPSLIFKLNNSVMYNYSNENKIDSQFLYEADRNGIKDHALKTALWIIAKQENALHFAIDSLKALAPYIRGFIPIKKALGAVFRGILRTIKERSEGQQKREEGF